MTRAGDVADRLNPTVQRRRVRNELKSAREAAALTQGQVAEAMDWSLSKVIRIENGSVGISKNDVEALLKLYHIFDSQRVDELVALARGGREHSWWSQYKGKIGAKLLQFIEYEASASAIQWFEPQVVPGLLQTPDYARSIIGQFIDQPTADRVKAMVDVRMKTQELLDEPDAPTVWVIIDEAVIRRVVGSALIMQRQLRHLADIATRPNVTVDVLPFTAGIHRGMTRPFVLLEFPSPTDTDVLYLENADGELITKDAVKTIEQYHEDFEGLRELTLGPADSIKYLNKCADEMG
jgi:transcriptional regulator with XRE-family HTH domain